MMTIFLVMFLIQYLPKIYHSVYLLRRMQNLSGYIFGTFWWGMALDFLAYFVASHWTVQLVINESGLEKILYTIFWGLMTLSTFGNLESTTEWLEIMFIIIVLTTGLLLVFFHATTSKKQAMQLKMRNIEWWMKNRHLPQEQEYRQRVCTMSGSVGLQCVVLMKVLGGTSSIICAWTWSGRWSITLAIKISRRTIHNYLMNYVTNDKDGNGTKRSADDFSTNGLLKIKETLYYSAIEPDE